MGAHNVGKNEIPQMGRYAHNVDTEIAFSDSQWLLRGRGMQIVDHMHYPKKPQVGHVAAMQNLEQHHWSCYQPKKEGSQRFLQN